MPQTQTATARPSPFDQMQRAVDIVNTSPHPDNKISATLFNRKFSVSSTNFWPAPILDKFGTEERVGNASGTVHAETACIMAAPGPTEGASLCVTDPFCPNCAKNMAEAGIRTIYIDHKGFKKDFVARRAHAFANMSMQICEKAGINVFELWRKEERLIPILKFSPSYVPPEDNPAERQPAEQYSKDSFCTAIRAIQDKHHDHKIAAALTKNEAGHYEIITVRTHAAIGYTMKADLPEIENPQGKYSFMQGPINRLLMQAARHGLKIQDGFLYASQVPTAREQVNMVGAALHEIYVGDLSMARDEYALQAMKVMQDTGILSFNACAES